MVARLLHEKGVRDLVDAAAIVRRAIPEALIQIAGAPDAGNPSTVTSAEIDAWRARGDVRFLGRRDDIPDLLRSADVAVLPSRREGTPQSLLEAAACGLALVATDAPGCREVVLDGDNGLRVPIGDVEALAKAILELLSDNSRRLRMGARSRQLAERDFGSEHIIGKTRAVHAAALSRREAP